MSNYERRESRVRRLVAVTSLGAVGVFGLALGVDAQSPSPRTISPRTVRPLSLCNPDLGDVCPPVTDGNGGTIPLTLPPKEATTTSTTIEVTTTTAPGTTTSTTPETTVPEVTTTTARPTPPTVPVVVTTIGQTN